MVRKKKTPEYFSTVTKAIQKQTGHCNYCGLSIFFPETFSNPPRRRRANVFSVKWTKPFFLTFLFISSLFLFLWRVGCKRFYRVRLPRGIFCTDGKINPNLMHKTSLVEKLQREMIINTLIPPKYSLSRIPFFLDHSIVNHSSIVVWNQIKNILTMYQMFTCASLHIQFVFVNNSIHSIQSKKPNCVDS